MLEEYMLPEGQGAPPHYFPAYLSRSVTHPAADMEGNPQLAGLWGLSWKNPDIITVHVSP